MMVKINSQGRKRSDLLPRLRRFCGGTV